VIGHISARGCGELQPIVRDLGQHTRMSAQQADGALYDRVEHGLHIRLRAADHTQDVAGGSLGVESRGELAVARLKLFEQPHVLNGNNRLVGEGLEQADLFLGEWAHLKSSNDDRSDRRLLASERNSHDGPEARAPYSRLNLRSVPIEFLQDVFEV